MTDRSTYKDFEAIRGQMVMEAAKRHGGTPWWQDPAVLDEMYGR